MPDRADDVRSATRTADAQVETDGRLEDAALVEAVDTLLAPAGGRA